jgi:hypothetical protein
VISAMVRALTFSYKELVSLSRIDVSKLILPYARGWDQDKIE